MVLQRILFFPFFPGSLYFFTDEDDEWDVLYRLPEWLHHKVHLLSFGNNKKCPKPNFTPATVVGREVFFLAKYDGWKNLPGKPQKWASRHMVSMWHVLLSLCEGNPLVTVDSLPSGPVMQAFDDFSVGGC